MAYGRELYAVQSATEPAKRQETERDYMSPLDSAAAQAMEVLERTGRVPNDPKLVDAWIRFVMSLMFRSPHHLAVTLAELRAHNARTLAQLRQTYTQRRAAHEPPTFEEYLGEPGVEEGPIEALKDRFLRGMIDSPLLGGALRRMHWEVFELTHRKHGFITGDEPVMASNGLGVRGGFVAIPIGPTRVFLAAHDADHVAGFTDWPERLENAFNDAMARQARRLVVGDSAAHHAFVDRRLGTATPQGRFRRHAYAIPARRRPTSSADLGGGWAT